MILVSSIKNTRVYAAFFELEVIAVSPIGLYSDTGWVGKRVLCPRRNGYRRKYVTYIANLHLTSYIMNR